MTCDEPTNSAVMSDPEVRAVQLEVLDRFIALCDDLGIRYSLAYGTLLGAARHQGFIPWDDDIDVMIPRADYETLTRKASALAGTNYKIGCLSIDRSWPLPFAKFWRTDTLVREASDLPLAAGVGIDIWPVDVVPTRGAAMAAHRGLCVLLESIKTLAAVRPRRDQHWTKRAVLRFGKPLATKVGHRRTCEMRDRVARATLWRSDSHGVAVGSYVWSVPEESLVTDALLIFEGRPLAVPHDTDAVLSAKYGDYRTLPPPEQRTSHHANESFWLKQ
jgi:lipopolysaccharide cholinephosphotransferase